MKPANLRKEKTMPRVPLAIIFALLHVPGPSSAQQPEAQGQQGVTALERTLLKTHMRQETRHLKFAGAPVPAFAPTTVQCAQPSCSVRVEVSSQFFNVTAGNIARIHVKANGVPFPSTGFDIDGGINRPVATQTTAAYLKTDLPAGSHTITVDLDMRSADGAAEAGIRTLLVQVFAP